MKNKILWVLVFLLCLSYVTALEAEVIDGANVLTNEQEIRDIITASKVGGKIILKTVGSADLEEESKILKDVDKCTIFILYEKDKKVRIAFEKCNRLDEGRLSFLKNFDVGHDYNTKLKELVQKIVSLIDDPKAEECKPVYEGDKSDDKRLKIVFLGSGFANEAEFKKNIVDNIIKKGFMEYQPFKKYTGDGKKGSFYFAYGEHNIPIEYETNGIVKENSLSKVILSRNKCPGFYYTILLDKNWGEDNKHDKLLGFYIEGMKISFAKIEPSVVMHETGHRFELNDEYIYNGNKGVVIDLVKIKYTNCQQNTQLWDKYFMGVFDSRVYFKGCITGGRWRSSETSLMKTPIGTKFNFLSCLYIVDEFEGKKGFEKVKPICKLMYDSKDLQQQG